jgi:prolyl-tRNA editing enzyme YbaK/EbsC (Cys-tRNA(Pro) deacylase)
MLNSIDLQRFVDENRIDAVILPLGTHTSTVAEAAAALGVETNQIIKSLVFQVEEDPILVINNGLARVDRKKVAMFLGVGKNRVKFASPGKALEVTGFEVGAMPPFGHLQPLRTLMDKAVADQKVIFGGGGAMDTMMRLAPAELLRVTGGEVIELSE